MTYTTSQPSICAIRPGDSNFIIQTDLTIATRAGFEISQNIPARYERVLQECMKNGWLKPVAYATEQELLMFILGSK